MSIGPTPLRLGVVGCGAVAELCHLPALAGGTPFRVTALVDRIPEHAERAAEQHRRLRKTKGLDEQATPLCATDITDVLDAIDVAIVATAPNSHAMLAIQLALAGKHVLLEKPIAATIDECIAIRHALASTGVTVLPAHVRRFYPMVAWVAQRLVSGELGTVRQVQWREGLKYGWPAVTTFTFEAGAGGGILADLGPHVLDLLRYWFGPLELQRCQDNSAGGVDSEARLALRAGSTGIGVELSRLRDLENTVIIEGTQATLRVEIQRVAGYQWWTGDGMLLERGDVPAAFSGTLTREGLF
ncbi:MAG TPA: Gfo/Idh/MocA family oxidoreductase, partial [Pseudonocardiaceae bacterium]|nr:Gfo/Idh/MocA family oxidoreductase [Pseudonocardiaceae bacterium]